MTAAVFPTPNYDLEGELARLVRDCGLTKVRPIGSGVQFLVFAAEHAGHGSVAVRMPRIDVIDTVTDRSTPSARLVEQEHQITAALADRGLPVARPLEVRHTTTGLPVLISTFVAVDGRPPDWRAVGRLFAQVHALPPPESLPTQPAGVALPALVAERLRFRMTNLRELRPELPDLPAEPELRERLAADRHRNSLLHLDIRVDNLLCRRGAAHALIDWSNALIGSCALELARMSEYATIEENEIDEGAFRAGYLERGGEPVSEDAITLLYRLDAAVMLALVFLSVVPKPWLAPAQVARVGALVSTLDRLW